MSISYADRKLISSSEEILNLTLVLSLFLELHSSKHLAEKPVSFERFSAKFSSLFEKVSINESSSIRILFDCDGIPCLRAAV